MQRSLLLASVLAGSSAVALADRAPLHDGQFRPAGVGFAGEFDVFAALAADRPGSLAGPAASLLAPSLPAPRGLTVLGPAAAPQAPEFALDAAVPSFADLGFSGPDVPGNGQAVVASLGHSWTSGPTSSGAGLTMSDAAHNKSLIVVPFPPAALAASGLLGVIGGIAVIRRSRA